ncbi:hypothetical protein ACLKA6_011155 [Drosophila palustris]
MNVTQANPFKEGDFVFAKIKGSRAWPARILQSVGQKHNVFFYGTCNTAIVAVKHICPYELWKSRLGDPKQLRQKEFKRAVMHAELMVAHPTEDKAYYYILEKVANDSNHADVIDMDLCDKYDDGLSRSQLYNDDDDDSDNDTVSDHIMEYDD